MGDLKSKIREKNINTADATETPVKTIAGKKKKTGEKDKMISAAVSSTMYAQFTEINKGFGMSNNSVINMLIAKYVQENKNYFDE